MSIKKVAIIGAGIGGLTAAVDLAARGFAVTVLESRDAPGGKMRQVPVAGRGIDAGPTVFTMRWVFQELFDRIGETFEEFIPLIPAEMLARHAWTDGSRLDLFVDIDRSADAIASFAGAAEARRYRAFCAAAREMFETLEHPFIRAPEPSMKNLMRSATTPGGFSRLGRTRPFSVMWKALSEHFRDPRMRQLYGRYTTYCGSSPFEAPATLMLVAHVEQAGVWYVDGGMHQLARGMAALAEKRGAEIRYGAEVARIHTRAGAVNAVELADGERLEVDCIIANTDVSALGGGLLGPDAKEAAPVIAPQDRSLSAMTFISVDKPEGFPLVRHNVFFSDDYKLEFDQIFKQGKVPSSPTTYICAQDRQDDDTSPDGPERLLCLINAPANGDRVTYGKEEIEACRERTVALLERCGLTVRFPEAETKVATPTDFATLFPGSGGALYGRANHGWQASFHRPGCRTRIKGLYLAGGSVHPGPGVPMAALSGRTAAESLARDLASPRRSGMMGMFGGT